MRTVVGALQDLYIEIEAEANLLFDQVCGGPDCPRLIYQLACGGPD